jgi:hypothetical protein
MMSKNKRGGCDKMPSDDPSLDPDGDVAIDDNYQPKDSLINDALSDMLHLPADKQLPGVEIEAEDREDEHGAGELGGEGMPGDGSGCGNGETNGNDLKLRAHRPRQTQGG